MTANPNPRPPEPAPPAPLEHDHDLAGRAGRARRWRRWGLAGVGIAAIALAAACEASVQDDVLSITGAEGSETISLHLQNDNPEVLEVDWNADGSAEFSFDRRTFSRIEVDGLGGDDHLIVDELNGTFTDAEITTLIGGEGNDTLRGGIGAERLDGGNGNDVLDGRVGLDLLQGRAGDDVLRWDAGGSADIANGGTGTDRVVISGSGEGESFATSTIVGRVRVARTVGGGSEVVDLAGVEAIDIKPGAGADVVAPSDLAGTGVTALTVDLEASVGDDGQPDTVTLPPGPIGTDGPAATVDVLGTRVRVLDGTISDRIQLTGGAGPDVVPVVGSPAADTVSVTANGTDVALFGATHQVLVNLTAIDLLDVDLAGADDSFAATGNVAALILLDVDGGAGADTIRGGNGNDMLYGGADADFIDGQQGQDVALGDAGDDVVQWDPGDGNDTIAGGAGADRLSFNGSATNEIFGFAAVGDHLRFTRNIASIVLDLDDIETIDVNALAGADVVQPSSVAGTDLVTFNANFAGIGGVDDAAIDEVLVPPGTPIGQDGSAATVGGFGATVRVVGGSPTDRIHVTGTADADVVALTGTSTADAANVTASGTDVAVFGFTQTVHVLLTAVELLDVDLGAGNDELSAVGNVAPLVVLDVDGGTGADTIRGGNGADVLNGGPDADFVDGQQGVDSIVGGTGDDVVQWDPGDGNDTVDGGTGADRMSFNGSNTGEIFGIVAVGDHVRFTRNVASIVLELDGIETFDLNALGANDQVQVDSVAGTDLTAVNVNLAAFGGAADAVADQVIVNATEGDDAVDVAATGSTVQVAGLAAVVRITGTDPTLDRLTVNGLGGTDSITSAPEAAALMLLELLP
jgi:Ca2+-binding RTX toxin-like protein